MTKHILGRLETSASEIDGFKSEPGDSRYPLILHLENHCSPEGQKEVVALLESKLGDLIYATPHGDALFTAKHSPQSLKGKILIKVTNHFEAAVKLTCTLQGGHCNMANSYCKILS